MTRWYCFDRLSSQLCGGGGQEQKYGDQLRDRSKLQMGQEGDQMLHTRVIAMEAMRDDDIGATIFLITLLMFEYRL